MAGFSEQDFCLKFKISDFYDQDLKDFLETIENEKVCVISVIGKSSQSSPYFRRSIIGEALNRNIYEHSDTNKGSVSENFLQNGEIIGYYDSKSKVILLDICGVTDAHFLINAYKSVEHDIKNKNFLEVWSHLQFHYAKVLLMLFNLSNIVIVVHPNSSFDMSYVYLFQTLNEIRFRALSWFSEILKGFDVSPDWIQGGRPCSPRALFVFESCPLDFGSGSASSSAGSGKAKPKKIPPLKTLEHSLEDQIYRILRKSRVITNNSGNSLFAIPANQEFVYVFSSKPYISDPVDFFLKQLKMNCQLAKENDTTASKSSTSQRNNTPSPTGFSNGFSTDVLDSTRAGSDRSFARFLHQHISLAHLKGFDDNVGRHPVPAHFELPFTHTWFQLASKILSSIQGELKDHENKAFLYDLKDGLDYDVRFSDCQCRKIRALASNAYRENLPLHYTEQFHETRLAYAVEVFNLHARGPAAQRYLQQLRDDCEKLWKNGRQMCEVLSLTGNHCVNAKHRTEDDDDEILDGEDKSLQVMPHCSQVKLVSACNCGRKQATREDPFDVKVANHDFYVNQFNHCCGELEKIEFPIFEASTEEPYPAHISPVRSQKISESAEEPPKEIISSNNSYLSNTIKAELSGGNSESCSLANDADHVPPDDQSQSQAEEGADEIIIRIQDAEDTPTTSKEKTLVRQPSTTEYLPGMLHSGSPQGLLPLFSSWSLVCVGPSSLYSHNIGLQDQPGFIHGTNFLLPWDVTVKVEHKEKWPTLWEGKKPMGIKGKKTSRDGHQFNVKIFIGVEYECFRGHRFMCSSPERVLRATSSGLVKDNALKVTGSDMPLYFPCPCCPCRTSKAQIAQLMRIHVVTPKAPVHVTLNPRVQPAPDPCPEFFPTMSEPLKLTQSSYWVLRLPFAYVSDEGVCYPPRECVGAESCRLLKGCYNIAEQQSER